MGDCFSPLQDCPLPGRRHSDCHNSLAHYRTARCLEGGIATVTIVHVGVPDEVGRAGHNEGVATTVTLDVHALVGRVGEEHVHGGRLGAGVRGQTTACPERTDDGASSSCSGCACSGATCSGATRAYDWDTSGCGWEYARLSVGVVGQSGRACEDGGLTLGTALDELCVVHGIGEKQIVCGEIFWGAGVQLAWVHNRALGSCSLWAVTGGCSMVVHFSIRARDDEHPVSRSAL